MKQPKYKILFSSTVKPIVSAEKDKYLSIASLNELRSFLPDLDIEGNVDVLPISFNACVVNRRNKNFHGVDTTIALQIVKKFPTKYVNIEHSRDKVVGTIISASFSEFGTDKPLTEEDIKDTKKPFNITLSGIIWRVVSEELADKIEESNDPASPYYAKISASWELGFYDYVIAKLPKNKKNLEDAIEIIKDEEKIQELETSMKAGALEDVELCTLPVGDVLAYGIGLTETPAADVQGIAVPEENVPKVVKAEVTCQDLVDDITRAGGTVVNPIFTTTNTTTGAIQLIYHQVGEDMAENTKKLSKIIDNKVTEVISREILHLQNTSSHINNLNVKKDSLTMKIKDVKDITDEALKTITASEITDFISEQLKQANEQYVTEKNAAQEAANKAKADYEGLLAESNTLKTKLAEIEKSLNDFKEQAKARELQENFNTHMGLISDKYELDDETRKLVASQIQGLSNEDFVPYEKNLSVLLKGKEKKAQTVVASTDTKPNPDTIVSDAIDKGAKDKVVVPATPSNQPTLEDKWKASFGPEGWIIGGNSRKHN